MADIFPPVKQRPALLEMIRALGCRDNALRRDECGDWSIIGRKGSVYAVPDGFQIMITGWTAIGWNAAKKALAFATVTQDGDMEGGLIMSGLPTADEAEAIRHYVGLAKKRLLNEAERARLASMGNRFEKRADAGSESRVEKTASDKPDG
jgi:hypothetical protein